MAGGVRVTPEQAQQKWVSRIGAASTDVANGVDRVTQAPGQLAAAKVDKWRQNTMAAEDKWRRNVGAVSLEDWRTLMKNVGIPRIAQGAQAKQAKYGNFAAQFFAHLNAGLDTINRMPDTTFEERVQRAVAMMRHNRNFKRSSGSLT